jgi:hypothetical protein
LIWYAVRPLDVPSPGTTTGEGVDGVTAVCACAETAVIVAPTIVQAVNNNRRPRKFIALFFI